MANCGEEPRGSIVGESEIKDATGRVGLCVTCRTARVIPGARGTTYYLCELSAEDEAYPKYPSLPILKCPGYVATALGPDQ